jgi:hypothetical protein
MGGTRPTSKTYQAPNCREHSETGHSKPRDLHAFASKVGATARNVEAAMAVGFSRALISGQWVWRDWRGRVKVQECRLL